MSTAASPPLRPLAVVTGASGGIGEGFARRLAREGYDLALVARSYGRLETLANQLQQQHRVRAIVLAVDLAHPSGPQRVIDLLGPQVNEVAVLINNAGFGAAGPFSQSPESEIQGQMQVNMSALVQLSRKLLPGMLERQFGRILNVASTAAFQPGPGLAVYFATKAFVLSFYEALAFELQGTGVSVTCLCPGPVETGFAQRAAVAKTRLFQSGTMTVDACVEAGYRGLVKGQGLVMPGLKNKFLSFSVRFAPRWLVTRLAARLMSSH